MYARCADANGPYDGFVSSDLNERAWVIRFSSNQKEGFQI